MFKIQELKSNVLLSQHYKLHPFNTLEDEFDAATTNSTELLGIGKFQKKLNQNKVGFDKIWSSQIRVFEATKDIDYLYRSVFNKFGLLAIMKVYVQLDYHLKELKKNHALYAKSSDMIKDFYARYEDFFNTNVFMMMREDLETFLVECKERNHKLKQSYPEHDFGDDMVESIDEILPMYKVFMKELVEKEKAK